MQQFERRAGAGGSELDALTPRQRQILQLVAEGLGTRQIAERLFLSVKTVESHRTQMMQRLGIFDVPGPGAFRHPQRVGAARGDLTGAPRRSGAASGIP